MAELGYDLALLTITQLDGVAYTKLIQQAEARISKETGIATNKEQLVELDDRQARERLESEIRADTEKKLAAERLDAEREVETATISQQEALDIRRHEMQLKQVGRQKTAAEASHDVEMAQVELAQQIGEAEAEREAHLAQIQAEREAELRGMKQQREAKIHLAQTEAEATRVAIAQAKEIERKAALTTAEAARLSNEELAQAERAKQVALVEVSQLAESMSMEADAEANALQIKVDAQTKMELVKAEATATEKRARAAKIRAEATKAETAATGLAEAEVDAARVEVAEKQVAVTRAEGLAEAEVAKAQAEAAAEKMKRLKEVEVNAQKQLAKLYAEAPVLVDLEKMRLQHSHDEKVATIQAEASLKAFEALAPGVKIHIFGNGGQTGQIMANVMALSHGLTQVGDEVPLVGNLLNLGNGPVDGVNGRQLSDFIPRLSQFTPYLQQLIAEVNPRMLSSLKVSDAVERLGAMVSGQEDLAMALNTLKEDASFRVIGNMPISPLLQLLGLGGDTADDPVVDISVQEAVAS